MEIKDTYDFLLRATIPEIIENNKLPEDLRWKRGQKNQKVIEEGYSSKKLVWECISRAHHDVLSGRKNVEDYSSRKSKGLNKIALDLYDIIIGLHNSTKISSNLLIDHLMAKKEDGYRIGPIQKLVNMTLKYMFLFQLFGKLEEYQINENDCDCPLDSRIMEKLEMGEVKWTKDFENTDNIDGYQKYKDVQRKIKEIQGVKSKLSYDFENWQQF